MTKNIVRIFLFFVLGMSLHAQKFTFIPDHTTLTGRTSEKMVFEVPLTNVSDLTLTLFVKRTIDSLPQNWYSSMCFDQGCFAPFVDSVATTTDFGSSPLAPGETRDFSIHVLADSFNSGTAYLRLLAGDTRNLADTIGLDLFATVIPVSVKDEEMTPSFELKQNYPNPFNPSTVISWQLTTVGHVALKVFNAVGKEVATLVDETLGAGKHSIVFDAGRLSSGVYFYRLSSLTFSETKAMMILK